MNAYASHPRSPADPTAPVTEFGSASLDTLGTGSPALRFKDLLRVIQVGRSKAYMLMKEDPSFPKGIPLYDSENSPKFYWTHEAIAWLQGRAAKSGPSKGGL
ncbi:hypothetical protein CEK00_09345 [Stenotrophomonas maltophilia]|uniref:AlpA family phage regulatory protein n=1 Tax=Stenotrophomonas maltophilia TaxID=40324 RepID=A0A270NIC7_STEMA|nr:hypothetical protein CEK00_21665 [Stenotrophomonas maltophilia]PAM71791.1 hypothetical protein CEK00_09345 [Stenotrophomonas maltophilia]